MANVHDVAAYILEKKGSMTAMKLQKLVYYSQAWHLVWFDRPLFGEMVQAWANGPVVPALFSQHRGRFEVEQWESGDSSQLDNEGKIAVDAVLEAYGNLSPTDLSNLTHQEAPWRDARKGLDDGERGSREITTASLRDYYSSIE
jgi:uncharacterized phage-associated protein